ncbi:Membrane protein involved in the export of O-antigen and teichoic acid [Pelagirhabdus alkalitolerans]|uniref:Membrane protein involved in the export of O-antigen and teichoic acid n=1 Tax=Pelagirhabdus alkalitolerans TaxID=1612202 RepID=A0A1G6HIA5_9BACI|nr:polysaccharide biosynthesis protein [Pelagirhabdus alkalitolerans]SDB93828.1 Membrane protein involved in the export of O-antigen and teichoic acid [Pelagirhabdus alkalitolerans]
MSKNTIVRGTVLLTGATFLSKLLGMLYTIPFESLVGATGGTLYGLAYGPYSIFISLSTIGIPLAVSKFVAKYNSLGDYKTSYRMYRLALRLMMITGFVTFIILFGGASVLARIYIPDDANNISVEDVTMVIRMVSFALLIIPSMSITRGFFQGYQSMGPTAISQVIEQIVRITFLLLSVYVVLYIFDGTVTLAVGFATFAAFVGAIASAIVLFWYWKKRKRHINRYIKNQRSVESNVSTKQLFQELFSYAGPFVFVGLAIPLYQQIDAITFTRTLVQLDYDQSVITNTFSNINLYGHKLILIPITLSTGMSLATLPTLTKSFVDRNRSLLFQQINQSLQIIVLLILPAVVGMSLLSHEVWGAFYGVNQHIELNGYILGWYAPVALFFALFTVTSSILQGISQQRFAIYSLAVGLLLKSILTIPFLNLFGPVGAVLATGLASFSTVAINLWRIRRSVGFPLKAFIKRTVLMMIFTLFMTIAVLVMRQIVGLGLTYEEGRLANIMILMMTVPVGAGVYLWFGYQSTLIERVIGQKISFLDRFKRK